MSLNARSLRALKGVHPDLVSVVMRAHEMAVAKGHDFIITEGLRTLARQKVLVAQGASRTLNSRHLTGHAVDFAPLIQGRLTWKTPAFIPVIAYFMAASKELKVPIESGANWTSFKDYPHIQLPWKRYP
jgi:peptidoglycan L-alanyl-D-glutamate endopeptidase CwlK